MKNFDKLSKQFLSGVDPAKLDSLLKSGEVANLSKHVDPKSVEAAAKSGDSAALSDMLAKILATEEGKKLAQRLKDMNK